MHWSLLPPTRQYVLRATTHQLLALHCHHTHLAQLMVGSHLLRNEIAWRLYFLNNNNIFSFRLLFDLLIIAAYVVILVSVIILYTQNSFEVNKLRYALSHSLGIPSF